MRRPAPLIFLLAGLALPACAAPPESPVALSEPGETAYDKRGVGKWYSNSMDGATYLHIRQQRRPQRGTTFLDVVGIGEDWKIWATEDVLWLRATAYASEIDGQTYYNVKRVAGASFDYTAEGETPGFIIVRADVTEEDTLTLRFMDTGVLLGLLKEGRVRGRVVEFKHHFKFVPEKYLILDLSRPELIALIREVTPAKLFKEVIRFRRLRPSYEVRRDTEKAKP